MKISNIILLVTVSVFVACGPPSSANKDSGTTPLTQGAACSTNSACSTGFCVDGVCCQSACDSKCQACALSKTGQADGTCSPVSANTDPDDECSVTPGSCETGLCDGSGKCKVAANGEICRPTQGNCDLSELCINNMCPVDAFEAASKSCRPVAGDCDVAEFCTGTSAACPVDAVVTNTNQICRASSGDCDPAEKCDGVNAQCPTNALSNAQTVCRAARGDCDAEELCTGTTAPCPVDMRKSASTLCRGDAGVCDIAEFCTGSTDNCPTDVFQNGTTCRNAVGVCDEIEACNGTQASCPSDAKKNTSVVCRASSGTCDPAEKCDGTNNDCPANALESAASEVCAPYRCTGASANCTSGTCASDAVCATGSFCVSSSCQKGKRMFVTSTTTKGNFGSAAAADTICQTRATAANLTGTFKAWTCDTNTTAASRNTHATVPYYKRTGSTVTMLAPNWTNLAGSVTGVPAAPVDIDESGVTRSGSYVWTGCNTQSAVASSHCQNWTSDGGLGYCGHTSEPHAPPYSPWWTYYDTQSCANQGRIYCLEQ